MKISERKATLQEKKPKMDPKKRFFSKIPQEFQLLNQFLKPHIKLAIWAETNISGH